MARAASRQARAGLQHEEDGPAQPATTCCCQRSPQLHPLIASATGCFVPYDTGALPTHPAHRRQRHLRCVRYQRPAGNTWEGGGTAERWVGNACILQQAGCRLGRAYWQALGATPLRIFPAGRPRNGWSWPQGRAVHSSHLETWPPIPFDRVPLRTASFQGCDPREGLPKIRADWVARREARGDKVHTQASAGACKGGRHPLRWR